MSVCTYRPIYVHTTIITKLFFSGGKKKNTQANSISGGLPIKIQHQSYFPEIAVPLCT